MINWIGSRPSIFYLERNWPRAARSSRSRSNDIAADPVIRIIIDPLRLSLSFQIYFANRAPHFYSDSVVAGNNERLNDIEYVSRMRRCNYASPVHVHFEMRTAADVVDDCERRSRVARKYFYSSATFRRKHAIEERSVFETRNRWFSIRPTARNGLVVRRKKRMGSRSKRIVLIAGKNTNDRPVNSICLLLLSSSLYFQRSK